MAPAHDERSHHPRVGFLIAGVMKGGTTSLFALISKHPQVAHPRRKETHFFTDDTRDWANPNYVGYHRKIRWRESSVIAGEATPRYLYSASAMERINAYNPDMLILVSFRDPIERAFSHWAMAKGRDEAQPDFSQAVRDGWATRWPRTRVESKGTRKWPGSLVSRGFYHAQLTHALGLFARDQFLLLDHRLVFAELEATLDRIAQFIGVAPFTEMPTPEHERAAPQRLRAAPPSADDVSALAELYATDLAGFAETSGVDVSAWPTVRVLAGSMDPGDFAAALTDRAELLPP